MGYFTVSGMKNANTPTRQSKISKVHIKLLPEVVPVLLKLGLDFIILLTSVPSFLCSYFAFHSFFFNLQCDLHPYCCIRTEIFIAIFSFAFPYY